MNAISDMDAEFELSLFQKKKRTKQAKPIIGAHETVFEEKKIDMLIASDTECTYADMLSRIYSMIRLKRPESEVRHRLRIPPIALDKAGPKKTIWGNFTKTCASMGRDVSHVMQFFMAELSTSGSIDGTSRLILKGRFNEIQMETLLKKYFGEYVLCKNCKASETVVTKDPVTRLRFISCLSCHSKKSVPIIKMGYHAVTKADRKGNKQNTC